MSEKLEQARLKRQDLINFINNSIFESIEDLLKLTDHSIQVVLKEVDQEPCCIQ